MEMCVLTQKHWDLHGFSHEQVREKVMKWGLIQFLGMIVNICNKYIYIWFQGAAICFYFLGYSTAQGQYPCALLLISQKCLPLCPETRGNHIFFHTCRIGCHINGILVYLMVAYFLKKKGLLHFFRQIDLFHGGYKTMFR